MTINEAIAAMDEPLVAVQRTGTRWHGRIVGVIGEPCLLLELRSGHRFAVVLDGAELVSTTEEGEA